MAVKNALASQNLENLENLNFLEGGGEISKNLDTPPKVKINYQPCLGEAAGAAEPTVTPREPPMLHNEHMEPMGRTEPITREEPGGLPAADLLPQGKGNGGYGDKSDPEWWRGFIGNVDPRYPEEVEKQRQWELRRKEARQESRNRERERDRRRMRARSQPVWHRPREDEWEAQDEVEHPTPAVPEPAVQP